MSALEQQHSEWSARAARLWGRRERRLTPIPPPAEPKEEPEQVVPPVVAAEAPVPEPDIMEIGEDILWRVGVRRILASHGETMRRLVSHQRDRHIMDCRYAVAAYLRQRGWSYPRIGYVMNRDHSSIVHLLNPQKRQQAYQEKRDARLRETARDL